MQNNITFKINSKGGILSPGDLQVIVEAAKRVGVGHIQLGERQNIYFQTHRSTKDALESLFNSKGFDFEVDKDVYPNIVTSYASENIFSNGTWLSEGIYLDVLNSINYKPKLKINIVDSTQGLVPLFTGNLNFIASSQLNFWFLYIKHQSFKGLYRWPVLIYSTEVGRLAQLLSDKILSDENQDISKHAEEIDIAHKFIVSDITNDLPLANTKFPNYEGMNRMGDRYWLGIYKRDNCFSVSFLEALCKICADTKMGRICLTPWKSLIIKGIGEKYRQDWEKLLGTYGINMRHSSLELNWQIPDFDKTALRLKKFLVNAFDKSDVQTHGLGFTIKTKEMDVAGSIVIERKGRLNIFGKWSFFPIYNILIAEGYNPDSQQFHISSVDIGRSDLPYHLVQICKKYFEQLGKEEKPIITQEVDTLKKEEITYQCLDCLTVYNEKYGDLVNNIPVDISFELLPAEYCCPVCESPKDRYELRRMMVA